jgi:hypothetical protein
LLFREHFLQRRQALSLCRSGKPPQVPEETIRVDRSELIENHESGSFLELTRDAERIGVSARRYRGNDDRRQRVVELIG